MEFICDGTRNSKWYFDNGNYLRKRQTRKGGITKVYTPKSIEDLPDIEESSVITLKKHLSELP